MFNSFKTTLSDFDNEHGLANSRARLRMATRATASTPVNIRKAFSFPGPVPIMETVIPFSMTRRPFFYYQIYDL